MVTNSMLRSNGNGEFTVNWKFISVIITVFVLLIGLTTWSVTAKVTNDKDIEKLQIDVDELEENIVPRQEYQATMEYIKEALDEIKSDIKDIKNRRN